MVIPICYGGAPTGPNLQLFIAAARDKGLGIELIHYSEIQKLHRVPSATITGVILRGWYSNKIGLESARAYIKKHDICTLDTALMHGHHLAGKSMQMERLQRAGLPTPHTYGLLTELVADAQLMQRLTYPLVIKDIYGSKGKNVFLIRSPDELEAFLHGPLYASEVQFFIQEYIPAPGDYRSIVINGKALPAQLFRRSTDPDEFRSNISLGGVGQAQPLLSQLCELAERAAKAEKSNFCGVDIIHNSNTGEFTVLEVNSAPGIIGFQTATGINVAASVLENLQLARNLTEHSFSEVP